MKATLQQLDKAAIILTQIKELDASIIAVDSLALKVSENNIDYTLNVKGDIKSEKKESVLDSDGSLKKVGEPEYRAMFHGMMFFGTGELPTNKSSNTLVEVIIKDVEMLNLLGVLIATKYERREFLKQQIRELGIEL